MISSRTQLEPFCEGQPSFTRRKFWGTLALGAFTVPLGRLAASAPEKGFGWGESLGASHVSPPQPLSFSNVPTARRCLALTFDDGPHPIHTPKLLDVLAARGVRSTFFVIGKNVEAYPHIALRIVQEGHEIANHTWSHPSLTKLPVERAAAELRRAHAVIAEVSGAAPQLMRPPYGAVNEGIRRMARSQFHYTTIMWSVDPLDWKYRDSARVSAELLRGAAPGAILLCHDIHATTIEAIPTVLAQLQDQGFEFLTVRDLLACNEPSVPPSSPLPS